MSPANAKRSGSYRAEERLPENDVVFVRIRRKYKA